MTKKAILQAWMKSPNKNMTVQHEFREKMIGKTIINSGCTMIINATPELFESNIQVNENGNDDDIVEEVQTETLSERELIEINPDAIPESHPEKAEVKAETKVEDEDF